jgi:protein TonB
VTAADLAFVGSGRPDAGRAVLWLMAAAVAAGAHAGAALLALRQPPPALPEDAAPPAITIDLAPMPAAPQAPEQRIAPDVIDAPEVDLSAPDQTLTPAPPPPMQDPPASTEILPLAPPPDLLPPPVADALPAIDPPPEPPAEPAEPRPMSRPEHLRVVRSPEPEAVTRQPPAPSQAAVRAQVRGDRPEAAAAPRPATGTRGMSPAKWQARLMAHLERLKRYPPGARQRREEGIAHVRFVIDDAGNVRSAQLVRSSGHAELDAAVLALVRRASPVPPPPPDAPRDIVAPVRFDVR